MKSWLREIVLVAVAAFIGFAFGWLSKEIEYRQTKRDLASALYGEMAAVIRYEIPSVTYLKGLLAPLENNVDEWEPDDVPPERSFFVFQANADKIGILGTEIAPRVAEFYILANRLRENARYLGTGFKGLEISDKRFWLKRAIERQEEWSRSGFEIVEQLRVVAGTTVTISYEKLK